MCLCGRKKTQKYLETYQRQETKGLHLEQFWTLTHKQLKSKGLYRAVFYYCYLFSFLLSWVFIASLWAFSSRDKRGLLSRCGAWASHCSDVSCCRARAVERGVSSVSTWAQLPHSMWNCPGPGTRPMSPAVASRFSTSGPLGKSLPHSLTRNIITYL